MLVTTHNPGLIKLWCITKYRQIPALPVHLSVVRFKTFPSPSFPHRSRKIFPNSKLLFLLQQMVLSVLLLDTPQAQAHHQSRVPVTLNTTNLLKFCHLVVVTPPWSSAAQFALFLAVTGAATIIPSIAP
jgi:hypothetical protein